MKTTLLSILIISAATLLSSCESTTNPPSSGSTFTDSTLFALSEGGFGSNNAQLDTYSLKSSTLSSNIINPLGDVGNDIQIFGKRMFIVLENSNKILSVNQDSVADKISISFPTGATPYKMAQVSASEVWVTEFTNKQIAVMNTDSHTLTSSINLDASQTDIGVLGGKAFVLTNTNKLEVLDIATKNVVSNKFIGDYPAQIIPDEAHNAIIVLTYGIYKTTPGKILWVDANSYAVTDSIAIDTSTSVNMIIPAAGKAFVTFADKVSILDLSTHKLSAFAAKSYYKGLYDARTNQLIMGAGGYSTPGTVDILDATSGAVKKTFASGILPGHFVIYRK